MKQKKKRKGKSRRVCYAKKKGRKRPLGAALYLLGGKGEKKKKRGNAPDVTTPALLSLEKGKNEIKKEKKKEERSLITSIVTLPHTISRMEKEKIETRAPPSRVHFHFYGKKEERKRKKVVRGRCASVEVSLSGEGGKKKEATDIRQSFLH